jgi:hypothetical protein
MFGSLLALLLEAVVYDDCPNQWALYDPALLKVSGFGFGVYVWRFELCRECLLGGARVC